MLHGDLNQACVIAIPASLPVGQDWQSERHLQERESGHVFGARRESRLIGSIHRQEVVCDPEHDDVDDEGDDEDDESHFYLRIRNGPQQDVLDFGPEMQLQQQRDKDLRDDSDSDVHQRLMVPEPELGFGFSVKAKDQEFAASSDGKELSDFEANINNQESDR